MTEDLRPAFAQLRAAYRLVWSYTRRIREVIGKVDNECRAHGLDYRGWGPLHTGFPPQSTSNWFSRGNWSWDLLPGYAMVFFWRSSTGPKSSRHVVLVAEADSGYSTLRQAGEPDPSTWAEEAASSAIRLLLIETGSTVDLSPEVRKRISRRELGAESGATVERIGHHDYDLTCHVVPMEELRGAEVVEALLCEPVRRWMGR